MKTRQLSYQTLFVVLLCFTCTYASGQLTLVSDDFNDGNITANPAWSGNTGQYSLSNSTPLEGTYSLSNNTTGSISTITTQYGTSSNLSAANYNFTLLYRDNGPADPTSLGAWESFTNANINHWRFYLASNSTDPNNATGVMLEHSGNALKFIVRTGNSGWEAGSYTISRNTTYSIKVVAKPNGNWEFYVDAGTGEATTLRASQWPNLFTSGSHNLYMIFQSAVTSGNQGRFKWDMAGLSYKSLTISPLTAGVYNGDLETGMTNKALFGFAATASGGSIKIKTVTINNTNNNNSGNFSSVKLYSSTDNDYSTTGDNTELTGVTITKNGNRFDITNIEQTISNGATANYFLVADIAAGGASSIQLSMSCNDCGAQYTNVYTENAETVNNFSFTGNNYNFIRVCVWNNTTAVGNYTDDWQSSNAWVNYVGPPGANDVVMFSGGGTPTPLNVPTLTVKRIVIKNNTTVNFTTASLTNGSRTLTTGGSSGDDLEIEAGSALNVTSTGNTLSIALNSGTTASISGNLSLSGKNHTLTAASAGAITFASGSTFTGGTGLTGNPFGSTVTGSVIFASGSTLEDQVGLDYFSSGDVITLQSGSNYKHSTNTTASLDDKTLGNLILNTGSTFNAGAGTFAINGDLTGAGTLTMSSGTLNITGDFSCTGTFTAGTGTIHLNGTSQALRSGTYATLVIGGSGIKTTSGNIVVNTALTTNSGTLLNLGTNTLTGTITTITNNGTIQTGNTSTTPVPVGRTWGGTIQYNATAGSQTIVAGTYNNLVSSNVSGTNTAGGNLVVNGTLSNSTGTLDFATSTLTGTLSTVNNDGTIKTSNTSTTPVPAGLFWGGTVQLARAAGNQRLVAGTYNNLVLSATSGTNTATGNVVVNGSFFNSTGTLNLATFILTGAANSVTNNGLIRTTSTSATPLPAGKTWGGTIQYQRAGGNQTVVAGSYNNLTLSNTSNTNTASGNIVVNGTLITTAGGTFSLSAYDLSGTLATITNAGTIRTASTGTAPLPSGRTWNGTVTYNGAALQNVVNGTYNNLILSNSAGAALNGTVTVESTLTLTSGKLAIGSNTLTLSGVIGQMSAANSLKGSASSILTINGSGTVGTLFFDQTVDGSTNLLKNFIIDRTNLSGLLVLGNDLKIKDTLTPTAGTLQTGGFLTLTSTAPGTARILTIDPAVFALTGDVTIERYITPKTSRRWLFIASSVAETTIRNGWQDDIFITGAGTGGTICGTGSAQYNSNGFDASLANSPTIYTYDQNNSARWVAIPNTTATNIEKAKGYRVLVRGSRNDTNACFNQIQSNSPVAPAATTLSVKGSLTTGNVNVAIAAKTTGTYGYTLIGNPYACEIDFINFYNENSTVINKKYWTYDPGSSNTNYLTYNNGVVAGNAASGTIDNTNGNRIASGQAFFVESVSGGTATFTENMKTSAVQMGAFKTNALNRIIRTTFKKQTDEFVDNMVIRFSDDPSITTAENKEWDAATLNSGNFIAGIKGNRSFAIQTRPLNFYNDTVLVRIVSSTPGNFKLVFSEFQDFTEAAEIWLFDLFAGTKTNVRLQPAYDFTITSNAATQGGRFKLLFRSMASVLPVSSIYLTAHQKNNSALLKWDLTYEQDVVKYQVLKSNNGTDFTTISSIDSKGNSTVPVTYEYTDISFDRPAYYRIRSIEKNEVHRFSNIVRLSSTQSQQLFVYPNPVREQLQILLPKTQDKQWHIIVRNVHGSMVINKRVTTTDQYTINVSRLIPGVYSIYAINDAGTTATGKFIRQ